MFADADAAAFRAKPAVEVPMTRLTRVWGVQANLLYTPHTRKSAGSLKIQPPNRSNRTENIFEFSESNREVVTSWSWSRSRKLKKRWNLKSWSC